MWYLGKIPNMAYQSFIKKVFTKNTKHGFSVLLVAERAK
jgi:hypothetical protein